MGYLYLLGDKNKEGVYKIGITTGSIENRIKKLQTGNAGEIYLVDKFETEYPFMLEKMVHDSLFSNKILGEWYSLELNDVIDFKNLCEKKQKIIEFLGENNYFFKKKIKKHD